MSNKPKNERRIVKYTPTEKENRHISLCKQAYFVKGTTKTMKQLKAAAKAEEGPRYMRIFNMRIPKI